MHLLLKNGIGFYMIHELAFKVDHSLHFHLLQNL